MFPRSMNPRAATNPTGGDGGTCRYPDCPRPRRPSNATPGRPSLYCEQADPDGPIHNAANAWKDASVVAGTRAPPTAKQ
jgi:hypothetical protein